MKNTGDLSKTKRTQRDYSLAFKLQVVSEVEKGELTYKQAQQKYHIQGRSTVLVWLRKHGRLEWNKSNPMKGKKTPQQEIKELRKKLKRAEQTNEVLNRAVDIADATLGTSIRKKYLELLSEASEQPAPEDPASE